MKQYDFVIVGSGLFGCVFAREMTNNGYSCLVLEKRNHIGGNCYTENIQNISIHKYGPHIFRTNSKKIWDYINNFVEMEQFCNRVKVNYKGELYSFPINLFTLYQLWGVKTPQEASEKLTQQKIKNDNPTNLEEHLLSMVGEEIYEKFFYGYTKKQWGREPKDLPKSIVSRIPIRLTMDDNYYSDKYQGIPKNGYTELFENLLKGIDVILEQDYNKNRDYFNSMCKTKIVYTGPIDEFFDYDMGILDWRSLKFENETLSIPDFQGTPVVNYSEYEIPFTRITEHKHFSRTNENKVCTIITKEYPQEWDITKEKYYPINDQKNNDLFKKYKERIKTERFIFGGRLAEYKYYDMHQVIAAALEEAKKTITEMKENLL